MCHDGTATTKSRPNVFLSCAKMWCTKKQENSHLDKWKRKQSLFLCWQMNRLDPYFVRGKGGEIVDVVVEWRRKEEKIKVETSTHAYSSGCCYLHQRRNFCQVWTHKDEEETFLIFMSTSVSFLKSSYMENSILTYKKRMTTKLKTLPLFTAFVCFHADITFGSILVRGRNLQPCLF